MVTLNLSNLEINSTELDDITDAKLLALILAVEFFQHLINRLFLSNNEPHCFLQIDIILFVFFPFPSLSRMCEMLVGCNSVF